MAAISPHMLQQIKQNFQKRLKECVDKGRHLTDTVFRKWMVWLKCFELKIILVINLHKKIVYFSFYFNLKIVRFFSFAGPCIKTDRHEIGWVARIGLIRRKTGISGGRSWMQ
jgi:hypothetical protein